jgi:anti-repressor protein
MTSSALIPVFKTDFNIQTVDARELHKFLEVKAHFKDWIKNKIKQHENFVENQDYMTFAKNIAIGRPSQEYYISVSMAKHIAMAEKNQKGFEARNYFENCENELLNNKPKSLSRTEILMEALTILNDHEEKLNRQQKQLTSLSSVIDYLPIKNFCEEYGLTEITVSERIRIGRILTRFCKKYGLPTTNPTSYGKVGYYPRDVQAIYFNKYYKRYYGIENRIPEFYRFTKI